MFKLPILAAAIASLANVSLAQEIDFYTDSNARSWNLYAEDPATFSGTVVDLTCEITGDCAENCGDGRRQLGILRDADGVLVNLQKNAQQLFTGAVRDMLPFCGQQVDVDGLLLIDEDLDAENIYLVQVVRLHGDTDWTETNQWIAGWEADHPELAGDGRWYRRSARIRALLDTEGYFGFGQERDAEIKAEIFQ